MLSIEQQVRGANAWGGGQNQPHSWAFARNNRLYYLLNGALLYSDTVRGLGSSEKAIGSDAVRRTSPMTKEEEMLRERMRSSAQGISSFDYHAATDQVVVVAEGTIFRLSESGVCTEVNASQPGARLHTSLSADGALLGFVRNRNVFLVDVATGKEVQISEASGTVLAGEGDFIHQEEFTTYRAYWIAPAAVNGEYRVLYLEFDEAPVHVFNIANPGLEGTVDPFRYALAGTKNSTIRVMLASLHKDSGRVTRRVLQKALLPWVEYVPRGGWTPDGNHAWVAVQDRSQKRAALLEVDVADGAFPTVMHEQSSAFWVNVSLDMGMPLHHFADGSMLIASEEVGGFAHLYRLQKRGGKLEAITRGEWQVNVKAKWTENKRYVWVDEAHQVVYFMGRKDSPLESHLYCASLRGDADASDVMRLTEAGFDHECTVSPDGTHFVATRSRLANAPVTALYALRWAEAANGEAAPRFPTASHLSDGAPYMPSVAVDPFTFGPPTLFNITSHGHTLYGLTYLPANYDKSRKYPTVIYTYGGPHVQLVENNWNLTRGQRSSRWQLLASLGYVVSVLDNRGSVNRGVAFEGEIHHRMGTVEIDDQVAHVHHLVEQGITDPHRVAIYGASYGGYMSLMALAKRSDVFKLAFSFSPVTDWAAYDTGYTERYMGLPSENPEGYKKGSVVAHASGFPDEPGRLVLFHGGCDENVHFAHTQMLVSRLVELMKPYELQLSPEDRHGISRGAMHAAVKMITHIQAHL